MAKWGEGDERWRVDDLGEAGRNVNNWHWTEKDALPWAKQRLAALLGGVQLCPGGPNDLRITGLSKVEGEAVVNNRKKKMIVAYELDVRLDWEGSVEGEAVRGQIRLPYVSEENHDEDPEIQVVLPKDTPAERKAKEAILQQGRKLLHDAISVFVKELRAGGPMREGASAAEAAEQQSSSGAAAAAHGPAAAGGGAAQAAAPKEAPKEAAKTSKPAAGGSGGHELRLKERFYAGASDLYECFTDARRIMAFTQSPAEAQPTPGGRLSMFGGSIQGEYTELHPPNRVAMRWRMSSWEDDAWSQVNLDIEEKEKGNTVVRLVQTGIPDTDRFHNHDVVGTAEAGWKQQVFHRIRAVFGYGVGL